MTLTAQYRPYRDEETMDGLENDHLAWGDHEPGTIQIYEKTTEDIPFSSNRRLLFGILMLSVLTLLSGFLIGYFAHRTHSECVPTLAMSLHSVRDEDPTIRSKLLQRISSDSIKSFVHQLAKESHIAGSDNDLKLAVQVKNHFESHHFNRTEIKNYSVLLSMPDDNDPNHFEIIDQNSNKTIYNSLKVSTKDSPPVNAYCAYSPNTDLKAQVIFVNYGRVTDYQYLHNYCNISRETISGKILIAKQFHLTADEQMRFAEQMGASALLLYPDPEHYGPPQDNLKPFPESQYMPSDAIRHDSLLWNGQGDPQTPGYPSTTHALRLPLNSLQLPSIPVQPISYSMALEILSRLDGTKAPTKWMSGFRPVTFNLGPGFKNGDNSNLTLHLKITNRLVNKTIHNVIGSIQGRVEPDRYIIIGNHRDAWFNGAVDASAGTAAFLELARVFGDLTQEGWRPRRTILFCSWGAEEFNLIGSTEFIEEYLKILHGRAVAYLNSDIIVIGNGSISAAASPLLYHSIFNATKEVPNPNPNDNKAKTVYDRWAISYPIMRNDTSLVSVKRSPSENYSDDKDDHPDTHFQTEDATEPNVPGALFTSYLHSAMTQTRPKVRQLDMRAAYAPFFTLAGIPALDLTYVNVDLRNERINSLSYPLLHTQYDRIELIEKFIDPDYRYHKAVTQVLAELLRDLSDSLFIPFNLLDYAQVLKDLYMTLLMHTESVLTNNGIDIGLLDSAIHNFTAAAVKFHEKQDKIDFTDPMAIRRVNDQLLLIERMFLDQNGLPRNIVKRHIVLSPSESDQPYDEMFPGLMDEFTILLQESHSKNLTWTVIRAHYSILVFTIESAANALSDVIL